MKPLISTSPFEAISLITRSLLSLTLVLFFFTSKAQNQATEIPTDWPKEWQQEVSQMDLTGISTGLLLNYALLSERQTNMLRNPFKAKDGSFQTAIRAKDWFKFYQQLRAADLRRSRLPIDKASLHGSNSQRKDGSTLVPIGILNMEGNLLTDQQINDNKEAKKQRKAADAKQYETIPILMTSVLEEEVYQGSVSFQFDPSKQFTNTGTVIQEAGIDFLDGKGYQMVHLGAPQSINYQFTTAGNKVILIKLKTDKGEYVSISQLSVKSVIAYPSGIQFSLQAEKVMSAASNKGARTSSITGGQLQAVLGCDGILDKPVLIVEGFDPGNKRDMNVLISSYLGSYNGTHYTGVFNQLTDSGYDLVFLNFNEARDYIQNNANVVKAAIRQLNRAIADINNAKIIVVGESAGGVIARYAIKKLEQEGYYHNVSHYISFDAPHRGANVPLGIQYLARDAGNNQIVQLASLFNAQVQQLYSIIDDGNQPAAHQLIMVQADPQYLVYVHQDFTNLQNELAQLGYPSQSRNVALVCGSLNGTGQQNTNTNPESQGQDMISLGGWYADANARTPVTGQSTRMSHLKLSPIVFSNFNGTVPKNPDIVPGGFDRSVADQVDPGIGFLYSFIPTYSSIDSPTAINSDFDMYQITANSSTPFAHIYGDGNNTEHVNVTSKAFAWQTLFGAEFGIGAFPTCQAPASVYPPAPEFSAPSSLCNGQGASINAGNASGGLVYLDYNWKLINLNNGYTTIATGTGPTFNISSSSLSTGYYMIVLYDNYPGHPNEYGSTSAVIAINMNCTSGYRKAAPEETKSISVSPNPSDGRMLVSLPQIDNEPIDMTLINTKGIAIYKQTVVNEDQHQIEVKNQAPGIYILRVSSGSQQWIKKVLINR